MDQQLLSSVNAVVVAMNSLQRKMPSRFEIIALSLIHLDAMAGGINNGELSLESEADKTDRQKNHFQNLLEDADLINQCFNTYYQQQKNK